MFEKYNDYAFVALDFDRTIVSGHMHQYFVTLYPDKSPNEIFEMYRETGLDGFRRMLRDIAIFTHLNDELKFINNQYHPDRKELCEIFRSKDVIEKLRQKYKKDYSEFQPFINEKELKEFIIYRSQHDLPTAIVSNSMFPDMIKETLFVLLEEPYDLPIYTPDSDPKLSIRDNFTSNLYAPKKDKNELLTLATIESGVKQGKMMFMDDESVNCVMARKEGFETVDTPPMYDPFIECEEEPFVSRSPSPLGDLCLTPPATIGGKVRASSSTALGAGQVQGSDVCPVYADDSVPTIADRLEAMLEQEERKGLGRN